MYTSCLLSALSIYQERKQKQKQNEIKNLQQYTSIWWATVISFTMPYSVSGKVIFQFENFDHQNYISNPEFPTLRHANTNNDIICQM